MKLDRETILKEIEAKKRSKNARESAVIELRAIFSGDMTLSRAYAYIDALRASESFLEAHLDSVTLDEVLGRRDKDTGKRRRPTLEQVERGHKALLAAFRSLKGAKIGKTELYNRILAEDSSLDAETLEAGWGKMRSKLKTEGKLRNMRYCLPKR